MTNLEEITIIAYHNECLSIGDTFICDNDAHANDTLMHLKEIGYIEFDIIRRTPTI